MASAPALGRPPSLLHRANLPFAIGAVALVTVGAFENRAVTTVLPTVAVDLGGLWLFGAASAAPLISFVVATTVAGGWADRRGPVQVLYGGMGLFVAAELLMGIAPAMPVFVGGRVLSGFAEGLLDVGVTVLVAQALAPELRPRIFASFAAAWVLPSLFGPSVAGFVTEQVNWRVVFLLGPALLVPVWAFLRPAMTSMSATWQGPVADAATPDTTARQAVWWSVVAAAGLAGLTAGGSLLVEPEPAGAVGGVLMLASTAALVPALRAVLPPGTLSAAPGIPALTALRALLGAAFGTVAGLLPLMLTQVHRYGPAAAGVSLTITGIFWAAGSNLQSLTAVQRRTSVVARLRVGFVLISAGSLGPALLAVDLVPAWTGLGLWAAASIGIGICSPTISTHVLALSSEADQGRNSAASMLAPSVSQAVAFAASGAAIAWQAPHLTGALFAGVMGAAAALGALAALLSPRAQ